jgi:hypothetical protein
LVCCVHEVGERTLLLLFKVLKSLSLFVNDLLVGRSCLEVIVGRHLWLHSSPSLRFLVPGDHVIHLDGLVVFAQKQDGVTLLVDQLCDSVAHIDHPTCLHDRVLVSLHLFVEVGYRFYLGVLRQLR